MESMVMCNLPSWVLESEEDFPLGAKATPFLPSATASNSLSENVIFELPEWMENRESLGLDNVELFNDVDFLQILKYKNSEVLDHDPVDITSTIKPEDMLVPLSELQPHTSTLKSLSANPAPGGAQAPVDKNINGCLVLPISQLQSQTSTQRISAETKPKFPAPIPKIIICKKVATRNPRKELERKFHTVPDIQLVSDASSHNVQIQEIPAPTVSNTSRNVCDADNLISEMVQMIGHDNIASIENSAFNSMIQANMDDLLYQLESENTQLKEPSETSLSLEPASPFSLPSPVPSAGSLSPHSTNFLFAAALSPSEKSYESSPSGSEDFDDSFGQLEVHSYSKSPLKKKATRKSSSRKSPYADDRKERKKEQNKQAALRYRQKKKQEDDVLMAKIHAEEERQRELRIKHTKLKQELSCFKSIMRDLFIAKGVLSEDSFKKEGLILSTNCNGSKVASRS